MSAGRESVRGRLFLIGLVGLMFVPAAVPFLVTGTYDGYAFLGIGAALVLLPMAVVFFFPEKTITPVMNRLARATAFRVGVLRVDDAQWLLDRYLPRHPSAPGTVVFRSRLAYEMVRASRSDPGYGRLIVEWFRAGHDPVLLRNVLVSGLSRTEVRSHLDGTAVLDADAVAMLAALMPPEPEKPPRR